MKDSKASNYHKIDSNKWLYLALCLIVIAILFRVGMLLSLNQLAQVNYEEGGVGLMARHIMNGDHIVFWWSQPYLGTFSIYITALFFKIFPDTTYILRLVPLIYSILAIIFSALLAQRMFKKRWWIITMIWWIVPPAFLTRLGLTVWNYINCIAYGNIIIYLAWLCFYDKDVRKKPWFLLGIIGGLAFWDHLICISYIAAVGVALLINFFRKGVNVKGFWLIVCGYVIGSFPFWGWNILSKFETIISMFGNKSSGSSDLFVRFKLVFLDLMVEILGYGDSFWIETDASKILKISVIIFYTLVFVFIIYYYLKSFIRKHNKDSFLSFQNIELLVFIFVFGSAQVIFSKYDKPIYLVTVYSAVPLFFTLFIKEISKKSRYFAGGLVFFLLFIHGFDNYMLFESNSYSERRCIDKLISFLNKNDINHVYAHYRISWSLSFESKELITASDMLGFRNNKYYQKIQTRSYMQPYFDAMHSVDSSNNVAFVTSEKLKLPTREELKELFKLLSLEYKEKKIGEYTIFYDFSLPLYRYNEIAKDNILSIKTSHSEKSVDLMIDRNISSCWSSKEFVKKDMFVEITLKKEVSLAKIVLHPGKNYHAIPHNFKVEVSKDSANWKEVVSSSNVFCGIEWFKNHPKLNIDGCLFLYLKPENALKVRISSREDSKRFFWNIAEVFLYEGELEIKESADYFKESDKENTRLLKMLEESDIDAVYAPTPWNLFFSQNLPSRIKTLKLTDTVVKPLILRENIINFNKKNAVFADRDSLLFKRGLPQSYISYDENFLNGRLMIIKPASYSMGAYWFNGHMLKVNNYKEVYSWYKKALSKIENKNWKDAEEILIKVIKYIPSLKDAYELLIKCYQGQNKESEVLKIRERIKDNFIPENSFIINFKEEIQFAGFDLEKKNFRAGEEFKFVYYWKVIKRSSNWHAFVHILNDKGEVVFQDDHIPLSPQDQTKNWYKGEVIKESRKIQIPDNITAGKYTVSIGLWDPWITKQRCLITNSSGKISNDSVKVVEILIR